MTGARSLRGAGDDGLTLVELLVAISVLSVVLAAVGASVVGVSRSGRTASSTAEVLDDARRAVGLLQQEVRGASQVEATSDGDTLVVATDVDGDGVDEQVVYAVDAAAGTLTRTIGLGSRVLARRIDASTTTPFGYDVPPPGTTVVSLRLVLLADDVAGVPQTVERTVQVRNVR